MQLPDRMPVTDPGFVCPLCKEHACLGFTLLPSHLEVAVSLTDARTTAVNALSPKTSLAT